MAFDHIRVDIEVSVIPIWLVEATTATELESRKLFEKKVAELEARHMAEIGSEVRALVEE